MVEPTARPAVDVSSVNVVKVEMFCRYAYTYSTLQGVRRCRHNASRDWGWGGVGIRKPSLQRADAGVPTRAASAHVMNDSEAGGAAETWRSVHKGDPFELTLQHVRLSALSECLGVCACGNILYIDRFGLCMELLNMIS